MMSIIYRKCFLVQCVSGEETSLENRYTGKMFYLKHLLFIWLFQIVFFPTCPLPFHRMYVSFLFQKPSPHVLMWKRRPNQIRKTPFIHTYICIYYIIYTIWTILHMDDCVHTYNNNNMRLTLKLNYTSTGVLFLLNSTQKYMYS